MHNQLYIDPIEVAVPPTASRSKRQFKIVATPPVVHRQKPTAAKAPRVVTALGEVAFRQQLVELIPHVRAFAHSMTQHIHADDLAQDTMVRAWKARATYQAGTNMKAWLFTILRNERTTKARRAWRTQSLDPEIGENTLEVHENPFAREELLDVRNAMQKLPFQQRQALVLVTAAGMSYLDAAEICDCAVGTVKSRVNRARAALVTILGDRQRKRRMVTAVVAADAFDSVMQDAAGLQSRVWLNKTAAAHAPRPAFI
jgi:RNA polymerase sigma-70 factor (ECF subfamily)